MNDVSPVRPTPSVVLPVLSGKSDNTKKLTEKILTQSTTVEPEPVKTEAEILTADANKGQKLQDALGTMHEYVQNVKRELQFSVDQDLGRTVVKVVDSESGDLIRQIPEEVFLDLARKVKEDGELNLFNAVG
ncbi:MAG: FlaG protein [Pseudomonadota bacterium]|jgi:flagellar protein FlaG